MKDLKKEIQRLQKYADGLKQRLQSIIPDRHKHRSEAYKMMLQTDLHKTLAKIEKLK